LPPSARTEKVAEFVLDASVALRAFVDQDETALAWLRRVQWGEITASWPELAYLEIANGLRTLVFSKKWRRDRAEDALARVMRIPMSSTPVRSLTPGAFELALKRGLTPYDTCYVVLSELLRAPLVTADRRMAASVATSVLI